MNLENLPYRLLRRLRLQPLLNWSVRRTFGTGTLQIPLLGNQLGSALIVHQPSWMSGALTQLSKCLPINMMLDVGANEGQSIVDLHAAGLGELDVVAFEPNTSCVYYLQRLIDANGWTRVTLLPVALADSEKCLDLEFRSQQDSGASIVPDLRPGLAGVRRQIVPCFRLDQLIASGAVSVRQHFLLKIDVEGAELDVLRGGVSALRGYRPLVLCEVLWAHCDSRLEFMRRRNVALLELLQENEYEPFRLVHRGEPSSVLGLEVLREFPIGIYSQANAHQCDYVFVPREHSQRVRELVVPRHASIP